MEIKSPLTGGSTILVKTIPVAPIIEHYKPYDVSPLFGDLTSVEIRQCADTKYQFYYPYSLAGDDAFYQEVSKEPLYYQSWKEEHSIADSYIKNGDTVLEQGCANGDFLIKENQKKDIIAYGTELNSNARKVASERGINLNTINTADVVCSFQVLEHIADVHSFITEAINSVKRHGYIIFGVPNNESLLKDDRFAYSNMPPHHMGLWTEEIFQALPKYFEMDLIKIHKETLQPYHYRWYYQVYFGDQFKKFGFLGKVFNKIAYELVGHWIVKAQSKKITGHTIVAVFKKR